MQKNDTYFEKIPTFFQDEEIKALSQLKPWRSILQIILEWVGIASAIWVCEIYWNPFLYLLVVFWIGARMHALAILMHDAAHNRILSNRKWNDIIADVLLAWPLIIVTLQGYRQNHFAHHRYTNTDKDPDWIRKQVPEYSFPCNKQEIVRILFIFFSGMGTITEAKNAKKNLASNLPKTYVRMRQVYFILIALLLTYFNVWFEFLIYWMLPLLTVFVGLMYIRGVAEHFGSMEYDNVLTQSRNTYTNWFGRIFLVPNNVNYHLDHHLYPSIPFYNLPKLHEALLKNNIYKERAHITNGYLTVLFGECLTPDFTNPPVGPN